MRPFPALLALVLAGGLRASIEAQSPTADTVFDQQMTVVTFEDLEYPTVASSARIQGVVVVEAALDDHGNVASTRVISGAPRLVEAAAANTKKWKFKPNAQKRAVIVYRFVMEPGYCQQTGKSIFLLVPPNFATIKTCSPLEQVAAMP
jgi:TonB family protein